MADPQTAIGRRCRVRLCCTPATVLLAILGVVGLPAARGQALPEPTSAPTLGSPTGRPSAPALTPVSVPVTPTETQTEMVTDVQISGNKSLPLEKILPQIRTRKGRPFDKELIEEDVRRLDRTHMFVTVRTFFQKEPGGEKVIFDIVERPLLKEILFVGNKEVHRKVLEKELEKECKLKAGDALDPFVVEESRRHLEEFYHTKGFDGVRVTLLEGDKPEDRRVVFLINEGRKKQVAWVSFVGNTIADDDRLRTQIKTAHPFLWLFKGEFDRKQLEEDKERLTAYYRGLGFFHARIGVEPHDNEEGKWMTVTFVIDEGPRFKIRDVSVLGNAKYTSEELMANLKLKKGDYFNQAQMTADVGGMADKYGGVGYVFADIKPDPRFLEEAGQLDLIYKIKEGDRYTVGKINVRIKGEYPHTQIATVLDRLSFKPGDIVDVREIRSSEARLRRSQLFEANMAQGNAPKIAFSPPGTETLADDDDDSKTKKDSNSRRGGKGMGRTAGRGMGGAPGANGDDSDATFRGQSPDSASCDRECDITFGSGPRVVTWDRNGYSETPSPKETPTRQETSNLGQSIDRARLILTQQYTPNPPNAGQADLQANQQVNQPAQPSTLQWSNPTPSAPPSAPAYAAQQPALSGAPAYAPAPAQAAPTQAAPTQLLPAQPAPAQPAPAYGQQQWPTQPGTQRPVETPQGPYAPGPIFNPSSPFYDGPPDGGDLGPPPLPFDIRTEEAMTGRLMFSVGVNSDAGLLGSITLDEQNFDWTKFPSSWEDIRNGTAWRGAGQRFRIQASPGTQVQQYMVNFEDPYLFHTQVTLGLSGYYYTRAFNEYTQQQLGGRVALGYQFTPDFSGMLAYRGSKINITNPIDPLLPSLAEVIHRDLALHEFQMIFTHNKRDSDFMPTEGHYIQLSLAEALGSFQYPHAEIDMRKYFTLFQRPDGSGRQVLSLAARAGLTVDNTPIYERIYYGGFSSIRGFSFRGVSPQQLGPSTGQEINVGGDFGMLASAEYLFPITADDMLRGVVFCDTGTVEPSLSQWNNKYRVAPGFGLRIVVPAMGPAPIALDFAFPVAWNPGDTHEMFSFNVGFLR
jgi:outer membrane protein insertion porin family